MTIRVVMLLLLAAFFVSPSIAQTPPTAAPTPESNAVIEPEVAPAAASTQQAPAATVQAPAATAQATAAVASEESQPTSSSKSANKAKTKKPATTAKPGALQPTLVYVAEGCEACAGLMSYLRQAGVVLAINKVEHPKCSLFPTVLYSDGQQDHGERIYNREVPLPKKLGVEESGGA